MGGDAIDRGQGTVCGSGGRAAGRRGVATVDFCKSVRDVSEQNAWTGSRDVALRCQRNKGGFVSCANYFMGQLVVSLLVVPACQLGARVQSQGAM